MLPICVVNNYGQFNHLIHRALRDLDIDVALIPNTTSKEEVAAGYRGIILGGGPDIGRAGVCAEYLDLGIPVLGICLGLHIIARKFGGDIHPGNPGDTDLLRSASASMMISWPGIPIRSRSGHRMRTRSASCRQDLRSLPAPGSAMWKPSHAQKNEFTGSSGILKSVTRWTGKGYTKILMQSAQNSTYPGSDLVTWFHFIEPGRACDLIRYRDYKGGNPFRTRGTGYWV